MSSSLPSMIDPNALPPSLWADTVEEKPDAPPLAGDAECDLAVVGAGFTGLSAALHAAKDGASVIVLEASEPGWGASGRNGGEVLPGLKLLPDEIVDRLGQEAGERLGSFSETAPDLVFSLIEEYGIKCEATRAGWIRPAHARSAEAELKENMRQLQARDYDVSWLSPDEAAAQLGTDTWHGAILDRRGGTVQPFGYARGLCRAAQQEGVTVHGSTPVREVERHGGGWSVRTGQAIVRARKVLLATNAYTGFHSPELHDRLARSIMPVASFLVATEPLSDNLRRTILPEGQCFSDSRRFLLYGRKDAAGRMLLGGRGLLREPKGAEDFAHIEQALRTAYPVLEDIQFTHRWSGRLAVTPDYLPHIHEPEPGLLMALGYTGRGVALATAVGMAMGRYAATGDEVHLPLPLTEIKPIPFHSARKLYAGAMFTWYRMLDALSGN
ncbi:MAG: FAD-binding oxidoreductase [Pseudomonadota bacterium]